MPKQPPDRGFFHNFREGRYCVRLTTEVKTGDCDAPDRPGKQVRINPRLSARNFLRVTLHEGIHASQWYLDEEVVDAISRDLERLLTKLGYERSET